MKYFILFILFSFVLNATPEEKGAKVTSKFTELHRAGNLTSEQLEEFYALIQNYLDALGIPNEAQIESVENMMGRLLRRVTGGHQGRTLEEYFRNYRRPVLTRQIPIPIPTRVSVFDVYPEHDHLWDRIRIDFGCKCTKKISLALTTVLQFLANTETRKNIAAGNVIPASEASDVLYQWLRGFWTTRLTKIATSAARDAEELNNFVVRWHALLAFAVHHELYELIEDLNTLRREIEGSALVRAKMDSADRARSTTQRAASGCPSHVDSRAQSTLSLYSKVSSQPPSRLPSAVSPYRETAHQENIAILPDGTRINLGIQENAGGGDCLFLAAGTTRAALIDWVLTHAQDDRGIRTLFAVARDAGQIPNVAAWIGRMFTPGFMGWGGDLEIGLLTLMTRRQIGVFTRQQDGNWGQLHVHGDVRDPNPIYLAYDGVHYRRLTLRDPLEPAMLDVQPPKVSDKKMSEIDEVIKELFENRKPQDKPEPVVPSNSASNGFFGKIKGFLSSKQTTPPKVVPVVATPALVSLEAQFDITPNLANAQALIDSLNISGETISPELRNKLLAAGFKITGSKGKYVVTQLPTTSGKHGRDDRDDQDPSSGAGAGGGSGAGDTDTAERGSKKSRTEPAKHPTKGRTTTACKHPLKDLVWYAVGSLASGLSMVHGIQKRVSLR